MKKEQWESLVKLVLAFLVGNVLGQALVWGIKYWK
jgi:hypothetical protein